MKHFGEQKISLEFSIVGYLFTQRERENEVLLKFKEGQVYWNKITKGQENRQKVMHLEVCMIVIFAQKFL